MKLRYLSFFQLGTKIELCVAAETSIEDNGSTLYVTCAMAKWQSPVMDGFRSRRLRGLALKYSFTAYFSCLYRHNKAATSSFCWKPHIVGQLCHGPFKTSAQHPKKWEMLHKFGSIVSDTCLWRVLPGTDFTACWTCHIVQMWQFIVWYVTSQAWNFLWQTLISNSAVSALLCVNE